MRRLSFATFAAALMLMVPRGANAGMGDLIDTIIGLTGPQMVGIPMACEVILEGDDRDTACYIAGIRVPWPGLNEDDDFWRRRNYWVSLGGGIYSSTGKDSDMRSFNAYDVWMLALEPTLNIRSIGRSDAAERRERQKRLQQRQQQQQQQSPIELPVLPALGRTFTMEHGVGPSLLYFFGNGIDGNDFETFANGGIKIKFVGVTWRNITGWGLDLGAAYNLRIFPTAFTAEDFGGSAAQNEHEGREYAHGFSLTVSF